MENSSSACGRRIYLRVAFVLMLGVLCFGLVSVLTVSAEGGPALPSFDSGIWASRDVGRELLQGPPPTATVSISPTLPFRACTQVGMTTTVEIWVNDVEDFYGYELLVGYDPSIVRILDNYTFLPNRCTLSTNGIRVKLGDFISPDCQLRNAADNTLGILDLVTGQLDPSEPVDGSGVIAIITFEGLQDGLSPVTIDWQILSDPEGIQIHANVAHGQVQVGGVCGGCQVSGTVFADEDADGILDAGEAGLAGVDIGLIGPEPSSTVVTATTSITGYYRFTNVGAGDYTLHEVDDVYWCDVTPDMVSISVTISDTHIVQNFAEASQLRGQVTYQGRPRPGLTMIDTVWISRCVPGSITGCEVYTATTDVDGKFFAPCMPFGTWDYFVRDLHSLFGRRCGVNMALGRTSLDFGTLIEGDVNWDCVIDISDLAIFGAHYGETPASPTWDPRTDFNNDQIIDVQDLALIGANYGMTCPGACP